MKYMLLLLFFTINIFADSYKVELINDPFDPNWLSALAAFFIAFATLIAGYRYLFVEGVVYKHTELYLNCKKIGYFGNQKIVEVSICISNKGKKMMTFYNAHLVINKLINADSLNENSYILDENLNKNNNIFEILTEKNIITEDDEYVRLHADTSYNINSYILIDEEIDLIKVELFVLYINKRIVDFKKGFDMSSLDNQEFNSIEKIFKIEIL